ncbi:unnamed protein product, partial [Prorocentrum cordatum]
RGARRGPAPPQPRPAGAAGPAGCRGCMRPMQIGGLPKRAKPPSDTQCHGCSANFGCLRRRYTCLNCDRYLCATCYGGSCVCCSKGLTCKRCRERAANRGELEAAKSTMETGVMVNLGIPKPGPLAYVAGPRKLDVWLCLDVGPRAVDMDKSERTSDICLCSWRASLPPADAPASELKWGSLE